LPLQLDWELDAGGRGPKQRGQHFVARRAPTLTVAEAVSVARAKAPIAANAAPQRTGLGRSFNLLLGAGTVSSLGDGLAFVGFPLLASTLTHSPGLIAGVAIATRLPWLLVALPFGALADRVDRRRLLGIIEIGRMLVLLLLGLSIATHSVDLLQLYAAAFVLGSFETGFAATTQALLPELLPADQLAKGNGRLFAAQMTGEQFAGPALGGVTFAFAAALPFVADGITFAASAALLMLALPRGRAVSSAAAQPAVAAASIRRSLIAEVREGVSWLAKHRTLRLVAVMIATFAFCQTMGLAILVVYGLRVLHLTGTAFGLFVAGGATGNVIGALGAHRIVRRLGTGRVLIFAGLLGGAAFAAVGLTSMLGVALTAFVLEAVAVGVGNVATLALRQSVIPGELAGRVNSALRMCIYGAAAIGGVVGGVLATTVGVHTPFLVGGIVQMTAGLVIGVPIARRLASTGEAAEPAVDLLEVEEWVNEGAEAPAPVLSLVSSDVA